jgi:hypothetical protein
VCIKAKEASKGPLSLWQHSFLWCFFLSFLGPSCLVPAVFSPSLPMYICSPCTFFYSLMKINKIARGLPCWPVQKNPSHDHVHGSLEIPPPPSEAKRLVHFSSC